MFSSHLIHFFLFCSNPKNVCCLFNGLFSQQVAEGQFTNDVLSKSKGATTFYVNKILKKGKTFLSVSVDNVSIIEVINEIQSFVLCVVY